MELTTVIKRDGRKVPFDVSRIEVAVAKCLKEIGATEEKINGISKDVASNVTYRLLDDKSNTEPTVEHIQDLVEETLKDYDFAAAKAYIVYREERSKIRNMNSTIMRNVLKRVDAKHIENMNANVDEGSFSGRAKEASAEVQKAIALDSIFTKDVSDAHKNMLVYQHDLDAAAVGEHNCLNIDFKHVLGEGFVTRNGDVRTPGSFSTACQLVAVIFQCQSQVQFGGVASTHIDMDLAPYVKKSFRKHYAEEMLKKYLVTKKNETNCSTVKEYFKKYVLKNEDVDIASFDKKFNTWKKEMTKPLLKEVERNYGSIEISNETLQHTTDDFYDLAMEDLEQEGKQACEALYHNLNTLESRQGSQVPFTSINLGRDTTPEGRLVSEWIFNASINGIGKLHKTSIFPISIFQYKKGVNDKPGTPNYDLKRQALVSMSKRIYPNWANGNWSQAHEDLSDPDTFFSTMGKCKLQLI